jgi:RNA polymerase sigma-70 factor (ECF subfamily)
MNARSRDKWVQRPARSRALGFADRYNASTMAAGQVTELLRAWGSGDDAALHQLVPLVESELRRLAGAYMARERPGHTLQPTALVNEAFLRLVDAQDVRWQGRAHFFGIAARLMRRVLVDHARSRDVAKRGGGARAEPLETAVLVSRAPDVGLLDLHRVLDALSEIDERKARVVEMRFFGGMTVDETAEALGVSSDTVKREWRVAKLWLLKTLKDQSR